MKLAFQLTQFTGYNSNIGFSVEHGGSIQKEITSKFGIKLKWDLFIHLNIVQDLSSLDIYWKNVKNDV